ncbi:hypothetical protein [Adhaeribacter arboris]|uniref:hypothetical protein n=1 Tax=Adhaeribacter arboris TaxID=2072846 RepID=UPI0011B227EA|nr:hypothetical protein [Adhaeribacter arboris]
MSPLKVGPLRSNEYLLSRASSLVKIIQEASGRTNPKDYLYCIHQPVSTGQRPDDAQHERGRSRYSSF